MRYLTHINKYQDNIFLGFALEYRRQVGKGRVGHGIDHYLLDNRNRTQKWDE